MSLNSFVVLFLPALFHVTSTVTQAREIAACPQKCICISGNATASHVSSVLQEGYLFEAWNRFQHNAPLQYMMIYLCQKSNLARIPEDIVSSAYAVFLDENQIETVSLENSDGFETPKIGAQVLSLSNNKVTNISSGFLRHLPRLQLLILRNNLLIDLLWSKGQASLFPMLIELDLSGNALNTLEADDIGEFPLLTRLDLSGNRIDYLEGTALTKFPKLEHLDLSSNRIGQKSFNIDDFQFQMIRFLSLSNNSITKLKTDELAQLFGMLPSLASLDMSLNKITSNTIPYHAFAALRNLRALNLSSCDIQQISEGWINGGPEVTLQTLDLSRNDLRSVSSVFLSALVEDDFSRDDIQYDADQMTYRLRSLVAMETLYLNDNRMLSALEENAFQFVPNLRMLFLQSCDIPRFKVANSEHRHSATAIASSLPRLTHIWIFENPIVCDCYMRALITWSDVTIETSHNNQSGITRMIDSPTYTIESKEMEIQVGSSVCVAPIALSGLVVIMAPSDRMTCGAEDTVTIVIAMLIGPVSFAGSILLTILCGSIHALSIRIRKRNKAAAYYPKPELMRAHNRQQKWHNPPAQVPPGHSLSPVSPMSTNIGAHGGIQTNLVLGQISARSHHADTTDGLSLSGHPGTRTPRLRGSCRDTSSLRLEAKAWRQSDIQLKAAAGAERERPNESQNKSVTEGKRRSFPGTDVHVDSRTDFTKL